jgi:hypothetical protein
MRKVIRKRVRRNEGGVNLAADLDAAVAFNTGEDAARSRTVVRSTHTVVQGSAGQRDQPRDSPSDPKGPSKETP